jgi:hypothetical protein
VALAVLAARAVLSRLLLLMPEFLEMLRLVRVLLLMLQLVQSSLNLDRQ